MLYRHPYGGYVGALTPPDRAVACQDARDSAMWFRVAVPAAPALEAASPLALPPVRASGRGQGSAGTAAACGG